MYLKRFIYMGIIAATLFSTLNINAQEIEDIGMKGLIIIPSLGGVQGGYRQWTNKITGFDIQGGTSWNFSDRKMGSIKYMRAFRTAKARWYTLIGAQYLNFSYDFEDMGGKSSGSTFGVFIGLGWEWLLGLSKRHALGLEIGYNYGKMTLESEYTWDNPWSGQTETNKSKYDMKMFPIYFGGSYTFYFSKPSRRR